MAVRPVNLTDLVRNYPPVPTETKEYGGFPARTVILRNATLGAAHHLSTFHDYVLFSDTMGNIWVQHKSAPQIILPYNNATFTLQGDNLPYKKWLCDIHKEVRKRGRRPLDPRVPYNVAINRLYNEYYRNHPTFEAGMLTLEVSPASSLAAHRSNLKALNPYIAHRTWISKFLGGLGFTQMMISSMTKGIWQQETRKNLWSNIARLYTFARNRGEIGLEALGDFIQAELVRNHQDPSPRAFLLRCGVNVDHMRRNTDETISENTNETISENINKTISETTNETISETINETISKTINETVSGNINEIVTKDMREYMIPEPRKEYSPTILNDFWNKPSYHYPPVFEVSHAYFTPPADTLNADSTFIDTPAVGDGLYIQKRLITSDLYSPDKRDTYFYSLPTMELGSHEMQMPQNDALGGILPMAL